MCLLLLQGKGHARASMSLNTANPRIAQHEQARKLTCFHHFICCYACVVHAKRECGGDSAWPNCAPSLSTGGRWGKPRCGMYTDSRGRRHKLRHLLNLCLLQQSMFGRDCIASHTDVRGPALWSLLCMGLLNRRCDCGSILWDVASLTTCGKNAGCWN